MDRSNEYWKCCVNWLVRCDVLRKDHQSLHAGAHIEDLAYTLRDGVLLCSLVNTLVPDCIDMENVIHNPQSTRCLCMQNINVFLKACDEIFSLREQDLFEPSMLFDLSGFYQVLRTLSELSNSSKALRQISPGFSIPAAGSSVTANKLQIREVDIRRSLELSKNASASIQRESMRQDEIYEKIVRQEIQVNCIRKKEKRDFILEEIIAHEKSYLQNVLSIVLESYMTPLKTILSPYDIKAVFGDIEKLSQLHEDFYQDLEKSSLPQNDLMLSNVFLEYYCKFLIYGEYCANLPKALELLKFISSNKVDVKDILKTCQSRLKNCRLSLSDLLVLPMTHVLKYKLLLERLCKETEADHLEAKLLQEAYEVMVDVNNYVNDVKRDTEALQSIEKIESRIIDLQMPGNKTLKDFGHLHKDDELRIKFCDQKVVVRYVFVFDQVMLLCKTSRDGTYACEEALSLSSYKIKDLQVTCRWGYPWRLVHKNQDIEYIMYARNEDNKRTWMQAILEALDNIEPNAAKDNAHNFMMCSFEKPTMCYLCKKSLKGLIMQGYSCHYCNLTVHKMCIKDVGPCSSTIDISIEETEHPVPSYGSTHWTGDRYLRQYPWYAGVVHRRDAEKILQRRKRGTFMLRISPEHHGTRSTANRTEYAISLKTKTAVAHMRVYKRIHHDVQQYFLSEARYFETIVELMDFYKQFPLQENYDELNEVFTLPYKANSKVEFSSGNCNSVREGTYDENTGYLCMDGVKENDVTLCDSRNTALNCPDTIDFPDVSIFEFQHQGFKHHFRTDRLENQEMEINQQYENISPSLTKSKSNSFECETEDDSNSSSSNLQYFEMDTQMDSPVFKEQYSKPLFIDSATQTSSVFETYMNDEDIEKFGEYVVAALKLFKNTHSLRDLTNEIRKCINDKLDIDH